MNHKFVVAAALSLFAVNLQSASAVPLSYSIADWNGVVSNPFVSTVLPTPATFVLEDLEEQTFNFFTITTISSSGFSPIKGMIHFSDPLYAVGFDGNVGGSANQFATFFFPTAPLVFDDRTFTLTLSTPNLIGGTGTVRATIQQLSSSASSVPDGARTAMLLGFGFLTLVFAGRRPSAVR